MLFARLALALLAVPVWGVSMMLWPGGKPRGVNLPWGAIFVVSAFLVPALAVAQIFFPSLTYWYVLSLLPVGGMVVLFVLAAIAGQARAKRR